MGKPPQLTDSWRKRGSRQQTRTRRGRSGKRRRTRTQEPRSRGTNPALLLLRVCPALLPALRRAWLGAAVREHGPFQGEGQRYATDKTHDSYIKKCEVLQQTEQMERTKEWGHSGGQGASRGLNKALGNEVVIEQTKSRQTRGPRAA